MHSILQSKSSRYQTVARQKPIRIPFTPLRGGRMTPKPDGGFVETNLTPGALRQGGLSLSGPRLSNSLVVSTGAEQKSRLKWRQINCTGKTESPRGRNIVRQSLPSLQIFWIVFLHGSNNLIEMLGSTKNTCFCRFYNGQSCSLSLLQIKFKYFEFNSSRKCLNFQEMIC